MADTAEVPLADATWQVRLLQRKAPSMHRVRENETRTRTESVDNCFPVTSVSGLLWIASEASTRHHLEPTSAIITAPKPYPCASTPVDQARDAQRGDGRSQHPSAGS